MKFLQPLSVHGKVGQVQKMYYIRFLRAKDDCVFLSVLYVIGILF